MPVTLELGGKSPQLVFADADLDRALPFLVMAGIQNAGQTCSASSRILVEQSIYEEVAARMADAYRKLKVGPALSDLDVGPMVSRRQKDIVEGYIGLAERSGARLAAQGTIVPDAPAGGAYVTPTLIRDVTPSHRLVQEEIFGPVQVIMPFDGEQQAIDLANGTPFRPCLWNLDQRRRAAIPPGARHSVGTGLHQQLRRRRRNRAAVRRRQAFGPRPREGF